MRAAAEQRRDDEYDRDTILAWTIVKVWIQAHQKDGKTLKLPSLKTLLTRDMATPVTPGAMRTQLHLLGEFIGIPLRARKKKKR